MSHPKHSRADLTRLFRENGGLSNWQGSALRVPYPEQPTLPCFKEDQDWEFHALAPVITYYLKIIPIEETLWAYITAEGHIIVPPFEWIGREFLSTHVW